MAIAEMRKVLLTGEKELREKVIKKLREKGIFQPLLLKIEKTPEFFQFPKIETTSLQDVLNKLEQAINFLGKFEEKKKFDLGLFPNKVVVNPQDYSEWVKNFKWDNVCQKCRSLEKEMERIKEETNSLKEEYINLLPWKKISFPLNKLKTSKYLDFQLTILPSETKTSLLELTKKQTCYAWIMGEVTRKVYVLLIFLKEERSRVEEIIHQVRGEKINLREDLATSIRLEQIKDQGTQLKNERKKILNTAKNTTQEKIKLMTVYDHFYDLFKERKVYSNSAISKYTFYLEGWIKKEDIPALKNTLKNFAEIEIIIKKPEGKEKSQVPVALSNHKIFKPFELITELYGLPRYMEIDPTPFMAPFFALFFALCLTDGGYGVLMVFLSFLIPRKVQVGEAGKKLFSLLFISGLVTIVVGTVTGGIFGIHLQQVPAFLAPLRKLALLNPMQEPMVFLVIALAVGIVHLLLGIALKMVDNIKKGKIGAALLDQFSWIILIIGLLMVVAPYGRGFFSEQATSANTTTELPLSLSPSEFMILWKQMLIYSKVGLVLAISGIIVLFLFSGRKSKRIGKRLAKGVYEVYGIMQLFADILSYSRLLALGLATSVIATVVNTIAGMAGGIPILGPIAIVCILILGHMGNLLINALSAFIHTARLQFVEFFTKFYESGGQRFDPLKSEGKYTVIREILR